jgi:hypothetical protein
VDPDPRHFGNLDPDPRKLKIRIREPPDPHHFGNLDPDPHQIKIRIRIRIRIKVIGWIRIQIRIRISLRMKSQNVLNMRIHNAALISASASYYSVSKVKYQPSLKYQKIVCDITKECLEHFFPSSLKRSK